MEPLAFTRLPPASPALCRRSRRQVQNRCGARPGAADDRPAARGSARAAGAGFCAPLRRRSVWGRLRSFELPGLAGPHLPCGGWPRGVAVPCAWARPFKLCFFKLWGCGRGASSFSGWLFPGHPVLPSAPPSRCLGVMSREGAGTPLVAEVIKGECGGAGLACPGSRCDSRI